MRNSLAILTLLSVISFASCCKQETNDCSNDVTLNAMEFYAGCVSKTALDGQTVLWQNNDAISIFDGVGNNKFITSSEGSGAIFRGNAREAEVYYAVYPYNQDFTLTGEKLTVVIPTNQPPVQDGFASGINVSVGKTSDDYLEMKNICGYVKFRITRSDVTSVSILSMGTENLAGVYDVTFDSESNPVSKTTQMSDRKVSMASPEGCITPGNYMFCLAPTKLAAGVKFQFRTTGGKIYEKVVSGLTAIVRRTPTYVGIIDTDVNEVALTLGLDPSTKTTVSPGLAETNIYLNTNCEGVTASVAPGATLSNVSLTKVSDSNFVVSFDNDSTGPEDFNVATIVFSAAGADDVNVTIRQNGYLILDLSDTTNPYVVPGTADDVEREIVQGGYTFKYSHCKWYKSNNFMFAGTNGGNTYISFPAIQDLTLKFVDITYVYVNTSTHKLNGYITEYKNSSVKLTEKVNNELVTADEGEKTKHLVLGTHPDGEQPKVNTAYQFWSTQAANSLMTQIKLSYE